MSSHRAIEENRRPAIAGGEVVAPPQTHRVEGRRGGRASRVETRGREALLHPGMHWATIAVGKCLGKLAQ